MTTTLVTIGRLCIIAAIVGGGLKAAGAEIPAVASMKRQVLLAQFGCILLAGALFAEQVPPRVTTNETPTNNANNINKANKESAKAEDYYNEGRALVEQQKYAAAEAEYRRAVELEPDNAEYQNNLIELKEEVSKLKLRRRTPPNERKP